MERDCTGKKDSLRQSEVPANKSPRNGMTGQEGSKQQCIELPIPEIVINETVNVRHDSLNLDVVDAYSEVPNLPPVEVMLIDGKHYLAEGEHRLHAAVKRADKTIKAVVVDGSTLDELRDHSDLANLRHGLPLTRTQKREVARRLHARHTTWSNRVIAGKMGVTHPTIASWLSEEPKSTGKDLPGAKTDQETAAPGREKETVTAEQTTESSAGAQATDTETPATTTVTCPKCGYEISI
jgi:uncharacterized ParB-like nuclease family protein